MLGWQCSRERTRSPRRLRLVLPPPDARPVSEKKAYPLEGFPPPSTPHPSACGPWFWQRSPTSGKMRCWVLPPPPMTFTDFENLRAVTLRAATSLRYPSGSRECPNLGIGSAGPFADEEAMSLSPRRLIQALRRPGTL